MEQILADAGALCLPVEPKSSNTVMEMVSLDGNVNSGMHFDTANFCAEQILFIVDVMNMVILNGGENTAKMANNAGLPAVMDITAADNMRADIFFVPSFRLRLTDGIPLCLGSILVKFGCPFVFIVWL